MDNKYYTPTIEEFHIGFKYEELITPIKGDPFWDTIIANYTDIEEAYTLDVNNGLKGLIRVKYLDKEDIESLGFEYYTTESFMKQPPVPINNYFINKDWALVENFNTGTIRISEIEGLEHDKSLITHVWRLGDPKVRCFFLGTIKNKSELKKLLQQLNILQNVK